MIMTSNVCLFLTILANKCTVRSMVIFLYIFFSCCTLYHAFPLLSWKITNILQVFLLGMFGGPGSLSQKLLFPNETIFVWLLERGGFVVIHFAYCCSVCASFLHWWNVYHCKTHVCLVSAGHVFEVPGSVSDSPKTGTYAYHDKGNGMFIWFSYTYYNFYKIQTSKYCNGRKSWLYCNLR